MTNVSPRMGHGSGIGCRGRPKGDYFYCGVLGLDIVWISKLFAQFKKNNKILIFQNRFCPNSLLLGFSMFLSQRVCLDWTAVSPSLGLSLSLSAVLSLSLPPIFCSSSTKMLCVPAWMCLPACRPCCFPWSWMRCPPPWSCLPAVQFLQLFCVYGGVLFLGIF